MKFKTYALLTVFASVRICKWALKKGWAISSVPDGTQLNPDTHLDNRRFVIIVIFFVRCKQKDLTVLTRNERTSLVFQVVFFVTEDDREN